MELANPQEHALGGWFCQRYFKCEIYFDHPIHYQGLKTHHMSSWNCTISLTNELGHHILIPANSLWVKLERTPWFSSRVFLDTRFTSVSTKMWRVLRYGWCPLRSIYRLLRPSSSSLWARFPLFWSIGSLRQPEESMLWVIYPLSGLFFLMSIWCSFCVVAHVIFGALFSFILTFINFSVSLSALNSFPGWLSVAVMFSLSLSLSFFRSSHFL